jgi:NAD(P)-dependent dehydrogenase (short-subunit alcohol dehydrogenase family)
VASIERAAIVTGASRGIGLAIAQALGEDGFAVTLVARQPAALRASAERLRAAGLEVQDVAGDLADSATMREAVARHREAYGRLDVLVNSAGMGAPGPVESLSDRHIDLQLDVNLRAIVLAYREATGLLREAAREHRNALVVNLASITAYRPMRDLAIYTTTKAAVVGLTRAMNQELGGEGIKSTALCPGLVDTDMTAAGDHLVAAQDMLSTADVVGAVRWLVSTGPNCVVPELPLTRPGDVT